MIIGIDASNIRSGGGVTHLVELLNAIDLKEHQFSKVIVFGGKNTLDKISDKNWLIKMPLQILNKNLLYRVYWQKFNLSSMAKEMKVDVLFVPGGLYLGSFKPTVAMSQNLLPFEWRELKRYGFTLFTLKLILLRLLQSISFKKVDGLIFLTQYAQQEVTKVIKSTKALTTIIPHGVDNRFRQSIKLQKSIDYYSFEKPYKIIYVSIIDVYKHQNVVTKAISKLHADKLPIKIEFIGPFYLPALRQLESSIAKNIKYKDMVIIRGSIPYQELHNSYLTSDLCLFASSCENMPFILLEGMASGLPIACSNRGPMPEILKDAGIYFDPEDVDSIYLALKNMILSVDLRASYAQKSTENAQKFTWSRCASETIKFLEETYRRNKDIINL